jgi:hypothetical protein
MGKSNADVRRREQGVEIKGELREEMDDPFGLIPQDGCPYYGIVELMMIKCLRCDKINCY